jgi:rhomboid protease GluP
MVAMQTDAGLEAQPQRMEPARPAPSRLLVIPALLAINAGVFMNITWQGVSVLGARIDEYLHFGANFAPLTTNGAWWRLITATFVHFGVVHLAFNMWALWESGRLAERLLGHGWFAAIYLFAGIAGGCASIVWNQDTVSAGASAAIFGVYGVLLVHYALRPGALEQAALNRLRITAGIFITYHSFTASRETGSTMRRMLAVSWPAA